MLCKLIGLIWFYRRTLIWMHMRLWSGIDYIVSNHNLGFTRKHSICISKIYHGYIFFFLYIELACNYTWRSYIFKLPTLCDLLWKSYSMNIINLLPLCIQNFMFWLKSIKDFSLFVNCNQGKLTIWRLYMVYAGFS